jgi:hypothetical protein
MPVLKNPKREAFAQALARGLPIRAAYVEAGYMDHKSNGLSLARHSLIQARVLELRSSGIQPVATVAGGSHLPAVKAVSADSEATVESLLSELELARVKAMAEGQTSAAISAIMGKAKLQEPLKSAATQDDGLQIFDLSHATDLQLATLEAIFGPLAAAGAGDGGYRGGESAQDRDCKTRRPRCRIGALCPGYSALVRPSPVDL